jgi:hypothetical protein
VQDGRVELLVVLASLASGFYGEPRMITIISIFAIGTLLVSMENIGSVAYRKGFQFDPDFQFMAGKKLLQVVMVLCQGSFGEIIEP